MDMDTKHRLPKSYSRVADIAWPSMEDIGRYGPVSGVFERKVDKGWVARIWLNQGKEFYRRHYPAEARQVVYGDVTKRHSDTNLVTCGGYQWWMPGDNETLTEYPKRLFPDMYHHPYTNLSDNLGILRQLLNHRKPAGQLIIEDQGKAENWASQLKAAGLDAIVTPNNSPHFGPRFDVWASRRGRLGIPAEDEALIREWERIAPGELADTAKRAINRASFWTLADFEAHHRVDGQSVAEFITTGYVLGYPPVTTLSCLIGYDS